MVPIEEQVQDRSYQEVPGKKNAVAPIPAIKDDDFMSAMLLPDPGEHDNAVYAGFNHCYGTCCLWMYCPCNVCCPSNADDSSSDVRIGEGYLGILTELGRFHSMMKPGTYFINRMAYEFTRVDMRTQTFRIHIFFLIAQAGLRYKFLSNDNVDIEVRSYINAAIIEPYIAIFRLKDYKETMRALCGGAVKAIITSNSSHDILKMAGKLDEKVNLSFLAKNLTFQVIEKLGKTANQFGFDISDFGITDIILPHSLVEPLAREAVSERLAEAKQIKAKAEYEASKWQGKTAEIMERSKSSMHVQYLEFLKNVKGSKIMLLPDAMMHVSGMQGAPK
jgi:regulator of protease activity HflC (stomatin/prohibitin superfamily)